MDTFAKITGYGIVAIVAIIAGALLGAVPVYFAWNAVIPTIFGLKAISFTEALWLSLLCSALFKSSTSSGSSK